MTNNLIKKYNTLFFGFAAVLSAYMATNILTLSWPTISLPTSDYFSAFARYLDFQEGRISFVSFIFSKHVDHNHAFVYLLSLIDISVDSGRLRLLHWVQIASHLAVYGLMLYAALKSAIPTGIKGVLLLFLSSQIFAVQGAETWVFPFQVVLASFRFFFIAGLLLFCREVINTHLHRQNILIGSLLLLLISALSHGAGIAVFALLFMLSGVMSNRRAAYISIAFFSIFILHGIVFKARTPLTELVSRIPIIELYSTPYYLAFLLGNSFAWGAPPGFQVTVGAFGIGLWLLLLVSFLKNRDRPTPYFNLFFISLSTFSLLVGGVSILLNLSYMAYRGVGTPPPLEYFLASRYLITTSGFWVGIAVTGLVRLTSSKQIVLTICLLYSSAAAIWQGRNQQLLWQNFVEKQKMSELIISTDTYKLLPPTAVEEMLLLPTGFQFANVLMAQKRLGLGPYAAELTLLHRQRATESAAAISDDNWAHGVARGWAGFVVINLPENKLRLTSGRRVRFADGTIREIISQNESGVYLNISLDGQAMDGLRNGFPNKFEVIE